MEPPRKSEFAVLCRALRKQRGLTHGQVASHIGVATTTYGNVETSPWKVINRERAQRLAELYQLSDDARADLLAAWERCPLSEEGLRRQAYFKKLQARRNKLRHYDRLTLSLVEVLSAWLMERQARPCTCLFGGGTEYDASRNCEFCEAIDALGLPPELSEPRLRERLAAMAEALEKTLNIGRKHGIRAA